MFVPIVSSGMLVVWDEPKRLANLAKHGLDFAEFEGGFDLVGCTVQETRAGRTGRARFKLIGAFKGRIVTAAIVSPLGSEALAIISFRAARTRRRFDCMSTPKHAPGYVPNPSYSQEDWNEVSDNPEWTAEDFKHARPFAEVFPELAEKFRQSRGAQKAPTKQLVSLRIDRDVLDRFKASGPGWQSRMNEALRLAAQGLPAA